MINDDDVELTQILIDFTAGDSLTIRIDTGEFDDDQFGGDQEAIAFDNIRITGDLIVVQSGGSGGSGGSGSSSIPEPDSLTLFGLGLAGLGFARRRRNA
ncbi:MAG: PEP-CTERM sorting domain-containing protein [Alphaproteobacteria bacterium]